MPAEPAYSCPVHGPQAWVGVQTITPAIVRNFCAECFAALLVRECRELTVLGGEALPEEPTELPAIPGTYNFVKANFPNTLAAIAAMKAGTGDVWVLGGPADSTTFGVGGDPTPYALARQNGPMAKTAAALLAFEVPASADHYFGNGNTIDTATYLSSDARLTLTGPGWKTDQLNYLQVPGGYALYNDTDDRVSTVTFRPDQSADRCAYFYIRAADLGSIEWSVDGAVRGAFSTAGAQGVESTVLDLGSSSPHDLTVRLAGGGNVFEAGRVHYDTTDRRFLMINAGASSWSGNEWLHVTNGVGWEPRLSYYRLGAHLAIVNLVINSQNDPAGTLASLAVIVDTLQAHGTDVILVGPQPTHFDNVGDAQQAATRALIHDLAISKSCAYVDLAHDHPTWPAWNGAGFNAPGANDAHPSIAGYTYIGGRYAALLKALYDIAPGA